MQSTRGPRALVGRFDHGQFRSIDGSRRSATIQLSLAAAGLCVAAATALVGGEVAGLGDDLGAHAARGGAFVVVGVIFLQVFSAAPLRKALLVQRELVDEAMTSLTEEAERHGFRATLDDGLRMCGDELSVARLAGRAFSRIGTDNHVELLLADASNAHVDVAAATEESGLPGCGVKTPRDCPAVRRGNTRQFNDSDGLDACPNLHDRSGAPLCATCIPVTVLGAPVGVVHATGPVGSDLDERATANLEVLADLVGSRLSVIRAMSTNERRANTDQLTGVSNRRSMDDRIRELVNEEGRFSVAFCDLDHFKDLNDTYGHEAGDRALRLFARVMSETVRAGDVVGRWGGEEFVLLFPDTDRLTAASVCERIRERLGQELASGGAPPFTASFGVADEIHGHTVDEILEVADRAMFEAKAAGRNRVVVADESMVAPAPVEPDEEPVVDV